LAALFQVRDLVQGVGFRPFVYRLANELCLTGWVRNEPDGVLIHVEGTPRNLARFQELLPASAPAPAAIDLVLRNDVVYRPSERLAILELKAARGWSLEQTAKRFFVCPKTIATWMKRLDEGGAAALGQLNIRGQKVRTRSSRMADRCGIARRIPHALWSGSSTTMAFSNEM
jgi:acylphosphatase